MLRLAVFIGLALSAGFSVAFARHCYLRKNKFASVVFGGVGLLAILAYVYLKAISY